MEHSSCYWKLFLRNIPCNVSIVSFAEVAIEYIKYTYRDVKERQKKLGTVSNVKEISMFETEKKQVKVGIRKQMLLVMHSLIFITLLKMS